MHYIVRDEWIMQSPIQDYYISIGIDRSCYAYVVMSIIDEAIIYETGKPYRDMLLYNMARNERM